MKQEVQPGTELMTGAMLIALWHAAELPWLGFIGLFLCGFTINLLVSRWRRMKLEAMCRELNESLSRKP